MHAGRLRQEEEARKIAEQLEQERLQLLSQYKHAEQECITQEW